MSQLQTWLKSIPDHELADIRPASADASFRRYFRVTDTVTGQTFVVMDAPPDKEDCGPFVHITQLLRGVHVIVGTPVRVTDHIKRGTLKLDQLTGAADGMPPLPSRTARDQWTQTIGTNFRRLRRRGSDGLVRMYGASSPAEYFAVTILMPVLFVLLATLALYARQSLLVAYILLGVLLGPWGLRLVSDTTIIQETGHIGIIFLLFLLGLNLHPWQLARMLKKALLVTLLSSLAFGCAGFAVAWVSGFGLVEGLVIGAVMMFSSTIVAIKLLPTTVLHHRHTGEIIISVLLLQDLIAIVVLLGVLALTLHRLARKPAPASKRCQAAPARAGSRWLALALLLTALPLQADPHGSGACHCGPPPIDSKSLPKRSYISRFLGSFRTSYAF